MPLTEAVYNASANTVVLVPRGKHRLPRLEQLQVNVSVLTDPMDRPINNGKPLTATVTNTGLIVSRTLKPRPSTPCSRGESCRDHRKSTMPGGPSAGRSSRTSWRR